MKEKNWAMIYQREIRLQTSGHRQMHNLTSGVAQIVDASGVRVGIVHLFNVGSTAAIGTIEFEPGLQKDLPEMLDKLFPPSHEYGHEQAWHGWQRPFTFAGHDARSVSYCSDQRQ